MRRMHWLRRFAARISIGIPLALMLALPIHSATSIGVTEKDFEDGLGFVERTLAAGKAKEAKTALMALLEKHKDQVWVLYHLTEVDDDLEQCAFWSGIPKPNPKDFVSGNLISYSPSSGQLDLRYGDSADAGAGSGKSKSPAKGAAGERATKKGAFKDFTEIKELHLHPLVFDGPFKITIHGDSLPAFRESAQPPIVLVCADLDQSFLVSFGLVDALFSSVTRVPARLLHYQNGEFTTIDEASVSALSGMPYDLQVVVTASTITANLNGTKILTGAKPPTLFGRFGYQGCPQVSEILVTGKVQPSWLQGVVDTAVQEKWAAFHAHYKVEDDVPDWLKDKVKSRPHAPDSLLDAFPGTDYPKRKEQVARVDELVKKKDVKGAVAYVDAIAETDTTPAMRIWLKTVLDLARNKPADALEACSKLTELDPTFLRARTLHANLEFELGSRQAAIDECRAMAKDHPTEPQPYSDLATLLLIDDHADEARSTVRAAIDAGIAHEDIDKIDHILTRALKGPAWARSFEYKSDHYDVVSDISQPLCFQAASLLEKFYLKYNVHLKRVASGPRRLFRVYLFSGQAGYQAYTKDLLGREHKNTAGLYSPVVKQLLIWNLPDVEDMLKTVRHEGFHQYLDRLVADAPRWLNEGMAEYFEVSKIVNGNWSDGEIQPAHVALLHKSGLIPLHDLLRMGAAGFYDERIVQVNYAESWAFVHFLLNSGPEHKKRFDKLLDALFAGTKPADAITQAFDEASLPALQAEFEAYVRAMK